MALHDSLPSFRRLSSKIIGSLLAVLLLALIAITATLLLAWQLEGSSAAINETSGLRASGYRAQIRAEHILLKQIQATSLSAERQALQQEIKSIDAMFSLLKHGDPQRPLYLPSAAKVQEKFASSWQRWKEHIRPILQSIAQASTHDEKQVLAQQISLFADDIQALLQLIEKDNEQRAAWLRSSQLALISLALAGTVALIYLMFLLIIQPVHRLQEGMQRMSQQDFAVRLAVETEDEFGQVTAGFNEMANKLSELYANLEQRVQAKTAELEGQNRELALLYDCASFLQQPQRESPVEGLCEGFLLRIRAYFGADGGSVRVLEPTRSNLHIVVHQGISKDLVAAEHCLKIGDCLCGAAVIEKVTVMHDLRKMDKKHQLQCHKEGFSAVSVFQILANQQHLGIFNLHFREAKVFRKNEIVLLETLGQLLGVALENIRLATRERAMAISEERNLVAQGLHDSIAQGLTFMNIQVQMLEASLAAGKLTEAAEIAPQLRAGVQESYEDVRELLQNFRSRLAEGNLVHSLEATVEKFRRQTAIAVEVHADGDGAPLPREHQLQILFIVQEALSNIRKHAGASRVDIRFSDQQDIALTIQDNGVGFDARHLLQNSESHPGLKIMRERAQRIGAQFTLASQPGAGTTVSMHLARAQRHAA